MESEKNPYNNIENPHYFSVIFCYIYCLTNMFLLHSLNFELSRIIIYFVSVYSNCVL